MRRALSVIAFLLLATVLPASRAEGGAEYSIQDGETVVGQAEYYTIGKGESLHEVAVRTGMGYNEVVDANPGVDPWLPGDGSEILIPRMFVLPHTAREGIVINLAEMRLYHYVESEGRKLVRTYPVGIGREAFTTPPGSYRVIEKLTDPVWIVPDSVREEDPSLPRVVPPGPSNPLGKLALRLSDPTYLIHGTNRPFGIGRRVSHGCIRMYPNDIAELYISVSEGAPVEIVYQQVKAGERDGTVFMEVHKGHLNEGENLWGRAVQRLRSRGLLGRTDSALLYEALQGRTGMPAGITRPEALIPTEDEGSSD